MRTKNASPRESNTPSVSANDECKSSRVQYQQSKIISGKSNLTRQLFKATSKTLLRSPTKAKLESPQPLRLKDVNADGIISEMIA